MIKPSDPRQLAVDILARSICSVKVGAAIADKYGYIIGWGWNGVGSGYGLHAECHAIQRSNKSRLEGGTIYVASVRGRNGKTITSRPCFECERVVRNWKLQICWRNHEGIWIYE